MGRSNVNRIIQIGQETAIGTPVAATKALGSTSINMNIDVKTKAYRAQGFKFDTTSNLQRLYGVGDFAGPLSFNELQYILSSMFGAALVTTPTGGTLSRQWLWTPAVRGADTLKSMTVEDGDTAAADIYPGVVASSCDFDFGGDDISIKGKLIGGAPVQGALTDDGSVGVITQIIAAVNASNVYMGTTLGANNATLPSSGNKITDAYTEKFSIGDKVAPRFVHNSTYGTGYKDLTEKAPSLSAMFSTEYNAQARSLFAAALGNVFKYVGFQVRGPVIEGAISYLFEVVFAANITPEKREDAGGVWGYGFKCTPIVDATLGSAMQFRLINTMVSL